MTGKRDDTERRFPMIIFDEHVIIPHLGNGPEGLRMVALTPCESCPILAHLHGQPKLAEWKQAGDPRSQSLPVAVAAAQFSALFLSADDQIGSAL